MRNDEHFQSRLALKAALARSFARSLAPWAGRSMHALNMAIRQTMVAFAATLTLFRPKMQSHFTPTRNRLAIARLLF